MTGDGKGVRAPAPALVHHCLSLGLAFVLSLLLQKSFILQSDEGYTLNAAWQLWNGMKMYDDFRLFVAPGAGYAVYWFWVLTGGASFLAARVLSLLLSFSSIVAVYLILVRRGVRGLGLALAVIAWVIAGAQYVLLNHNTFSSHAACWLLLLLLRAEDRARAGEARLVDHALVGVAGGVVLLFLQTKGLLAIAATAAFTLFAVGGRRGVRAAAALVGGAAAVVAPLLLAWRPSVLVREWFIVPLTGNYLGQTSGSRLLAGACLLAAAAMAAFAARRRDRLLLAIAVVQGALFASAVNNTDALHVAVNGFPSIVFLALALQRRAARPPALDPAAPSPPSPPASMLLAFVVAMLAVLLATPPGRPLWKQSTLYVDFVRRASHDLFPQPRVAAARAIYAGPFMPGLYFALGKKNPYFVSETVVCDDACRRRLLAELDATRPELAFLDYDMIRHLHYDANNPVDAYFRDRYVACPPSDFDGLLVRAIDPGWCP